MLNKYQLSDQFSLFNENNIYEYVSSIVISQLNPKLENILIIC